MAKQLPVITFALLLFGSIASESWGAETVHCEVLSIQASNNNTGVDQALASHAAVLSQPPFSRYNSFQLVERRTHRLALNVPDTLALPAPLGGALRWNGSGEKKLDLSLNISRPGKKPIQVRSKVSPGVPFFTGGFANPAGAGAWIFGIICNRIAI